MPQSVISGLTGTITLPDDSAGTALVQYISSVSVSTGADLLDVSRYGGAGWRTRVAGIKDLAGTCVAFLSKGAAGTNPFIMNTDLSGTDVTKLLDMTITFDTGCSIGFKSVIGNVSVVGEYQGLNIVTFSFAKSDGSAPTINWVVA